MIGAVALCLTNISLAEVTHPTIAIIIDDLGNHKALGDRLIEIPAPLTLAFLPMRLHTKQQARRAYLMGKEVMLHAPMENLHNIPLGAAGLTSRMNSMEMTITFRRAIRSVPFASGVNNHMGSLLTQDHSAMGTLMRELRDYPLYFVDSRTTPKSIAYKVAKRHNIPTLGRDIFLDNDINSRYIHRQFRKLIKVAKTNGTAIAIGHPYLKTVRYLERVLPTLGKEGISVATVKGIWAIRHNAKEMFANRESPRAPLISSTGASKQQAGFN